jgi:phenylacetate-CoA ligase
VADPAFPKGPLGGRALQRLGDLLRGRGAWRRHAPAYADFLARADPEAVARRAVADLRALLVHARDTVPFHRERMRAAGFDPEALEDPADLAALPRLTRGEVAARSADLRSTLHRDDAGLVPIQTGGTTGVPLRLWQDADAEARKDALTQVCRWRMGWVAGVKAAFLWGAARDLPEPGGSPLRLWKERLLGGVLPRALLLSARSLDAGHLDHVAGRLRRFRPHVLQAYPSAADALALRLLERGERLAIPLAVLTAEPVLPEQRQRVAQALGANVLSFYGSRECGWIAAECPSRRRLHVNTLGCHLEVAADGSLLVTDLLNRAMPLIRYDLGDQGRLAGEPCPCGDPRPVLAAVEGRTGDLFRFRSGRRVSAVVADMRPAHQRAIGIVDVQLVQEDLDLVTVNYVAGEAFSEPELAGYLAFLASLFDGEARVRAQRVARIEPEPNGKVRHAVCRLPPGAEGTR